MPAISLERPSAVTKRLGVCRSSLHKAVHDGVLPPPIQLGARWSAWPSTEIDSIVQARIAGLSNDEIRELVKELLAKRKSAAPMQGRIAGLGDDDPARHHVSIEG